MDGIYTNEGSLGSESTQESRQEGLGRGGQEWNGHPEAWTTYAWPFSPYAYLRGSPSQLLVINFFFYHLLMDEAGIAPTA